MHSIHPCGPVVHGAFATFSNVVRAVHWPQVTDKDADGVLDEIESAIFQVAVSILAGQGFSYR